MNTNVPSFERFAIYSKCNEDNLDRGNSYDGFIWGLIEGCDY